MLEVTITPDHVANGIRNSCSRCPVASAVQEATGMTPNNVQVMQDMVHFWQGASWLPVPLPADVRDAVVAFDHGRDFHPMSFTLPVIVANPV